MGVLRLVTRAWESGKAFTIPSKFQRLQALALPYHASSHDPPYFFPHYLRLNWVGECMGVYMCICIHVCLHMHVCAYIHTCMYEFVCIYKNSRVCVHMYICAHVCTCVYVYLYVYICYSIGEEAKRQLERNIFLFSICEF